MAAYTDKKHGIVKENPNKSCNTLYILRVLGVYFKVTEIQKKSFTIFMMR